MCTTALESMNGRKGWATAELRDRPGGQLYSSARALYIIDRASPLPGGNFELPAKPLNA